MQPATITRSDRRGFADRTTIRWRVMGGIAVIGLLSTLAVTLWGDPFSRLDEAAALVLTVLCVGFSPILEWIGRYLFGRADILQERLALANEESARLAEEAARLRGALRVVDFTAEADEFGSVAAAFWLKLEWAFNRYVIAENPGGVLTLHEIVEAAPWPDQAASGEAGAAASDQILRAFASSVCPLYGFELISRETFPAFDVVRRSLQRRLRQWGEMLRSDEGDELAGWLRARVGASHRGTLKLAWYIEIQNAERTGQSAAADLACYRALRDVMESGMPQAALGTGVNEARAALRALHQPRPRVTPSLPPRPWSDQPSHPTN